GNPRIARNTRSAIGSARHSSANHTTTRADPMNAGLIGSLHHTHARSSAGGRTGWLGSRVSTAGGIRWVFRGPHVSLARAHSMISWLISGFGKPQKRVA